MTFLTRGGIRLFFLLLLYTYRTLSLVAFDCTDHNSEVSEISLLETTPCNKINRNITRTNKLIQVVQPIKYGDIKYYSCLVELNHLTYRCGRTIDTFHSNPLSSEILELNRRECEELQKEGTMYYNNRKVKINKGIDRQTVSFMSIGSITEGSCTPGETFIQNGITYDRPVRSSVATITLRKTTADVNFDEDKIILENGVKCKLSSLSCFSADVGYSFWDNPFTKQLCDTNDYQPIYEGIATKILEMRQNETYVSYLLHYNSYDFQIGLTGKKTRTCGQLSLLTEHPGLTIIEKEKDLDFVFKKSTSISARNTDLMKYVNSKIVYATRHMQTQIEDLYDELTYERCLTRTKLLQNMLTTAISNPHNFAYEYFSNSGYTAVIRGEVIYLSKCKPTSVNITYLDNKCYQEIPVKLNGEVKFMGPRNRLLQDYGNEITCSTILPVKYKIGDTWFMITPNGAIRTKDPEVLEMSQTNWIFTPIKNLMEAGIYTLAEINQVQSVMLEPFNKEAITGMVSDGILNNKKLSNDLSFTTLLSDRDYATITENTMKNWWEKFLNKMGSFGNLISTLIGITVIIKTLLFFLNSLINLRALYSIFGISWRLIFAWWENLVHHFLREIKDKEPLLQQEITIKNAKPSGNVETVQGNIELIDMYSDSEDQ